MTQLSIFPAAKTVVDVGGTAVVAIFGPVVGGLIVNPYLAKDQGIAVSEPLYVDIVSTAGIAETTTTIPIQPGGYFQVPANQTTSVSVNAKTSGHKFSAIAFQAPAVFTPAINSFPPISQTSLQNIIPSYLYTEYNDDEDLQAFVSTQNNLQQEELDWFNDVELPVYTSDLIAGDLLDWVALGLYGLARPLLSSGTNRDLGALNTYTGNELAINEIKVIDSGTYFVTTDDVFKRILTWHLFKGDGKVFNIRWLKRRIMRFLNGVNGTSYNIDQTYQVSVSFGPPAGQVNIGILNGVRTTVGGAIADFCTLNSVAPNELDTTFVPFPSLPFAVILKSAIDSGVLELPFQFTYVVNVA